MRLNEKQRDLVENGEKVLNKSVKMRNNKRMTHHYDDVINIIIE